MNYLNNDINNFFKNIQEENKCILEPTLKIITDMREKIKPVIDKINNELDKIKLNIHIK